MKLLLLILSLFCLALWSCQPDNDKAAGQAGVDAREAQALVVRQPYFQLLEEPGEEGRPLQELLPGAIVYSLGQASGFTTRLQREGRTYNEPWLLVQTRDGRQGWAYAAAFLETDETGSIGLSPLSWRLRALVGTELAERIEAFNQVFDTIRSEKALIHHLSTAYLLRDTLLELASSLGSGQDIFWLKEALPVLSPFRLKQEGNFYLFIDFRPYLRKAADTPGPADDQWMAFCLAAFPEDSIEYFFPSWTIEDARQKGHSLLGRGIHFRMLEQLDKLLVFKDLLGEEIGRFRGLLLNDMTAPGVTYWEEREKAIAELDSILAADFAVLGDKGKIALQARRRQFEEPDQYGIQFNHRSGIYEPGGVEVQKK